MLVTRSNTWLPNGSAKALACASAAGIRWRALRYVTASPSKIGDITRAAVLLTHFEHDYIT